jgi:hypothetical protein
LSVYLGLKEKKNKDGAHIQHGEFFWHLFLRALIFVRNLKLQNFKNILEEQTQKEKNCGLKTKF